MNYIYTAIISYLFGCLNGAYFVGKAKHVDIKQTGTKNAGASNVFMSVGKKYGVLVFAIDALKAVTAIYICTHLFPEEHILVHAGFFVVMGHIFPFFMHFNGGKGLSCLIGFGLYYLIPRHPLFTLFYAVCLIIFTIVSNYIVALTMGLSLTLPAVYYYFSHDTVGLVLLLTIALIFIVKHIENFKRILNHTEKHLISEVKRKH